MKKLSQSLMAQTIIAKRKEKKMTQQQLSDATGINRAVISRMESLDFMPSIPQLEVLGEVLGFELTELFVNGTAEEKKQHEPMNIAVAGTGYVGLSIATLLAQHNHVTAVDIVPETEHVRISLRIVYCRWQDIMLTMMTISGIPLWKKM